MLQFDWFKLFDLQHELPTPNLNKSKESSQNLTDAVEIKASDFQGRAPTDEVKVFKF